MSGSDTIVHVVNIFCIDTIIFMAKIFSAYKNAAKKKLCVDFYSKNFAVFVLIIYQIERKLMKQLQKMQYIVLSLALLD